MSQLSALRGFLNINKPAGLTSRDVVNRIQRLARPAKVGHAGTLDPLATGVLVVAIGPATRLIEFVQQMPKEYRATFLLGRTSTTEDIEGEVVELAGAHVPVRDEIVAATARLTGDILQRPPAFSALKIAGRRAYQLARRGEEPELAPRPITIHQFEVLRYDYPELEVAIRCSSGTYVRSLGRDLAESLGTAAVMSALVRTAVGDFCIQESMPLDELSIESLTSRLQPVSHGVRNLPRFNLSAAEATDIRHGRALATLGKISGEMVAAFDPAGQLIGVLAVGSRGLAPLRVLPYESSDRPE